MTCPDITYSLEEWQSISSTEPPASLPQSAVNLINELAALVGAPTYVRTPVFTRESARGGGGCGGGGGGGIPTSRCAGGRRRGNRPKQLSDDDWEAMRSFESTTKVVREGPEVFVDQIRKAINKLSDANFTTQLTEIVVQFSNGEEECDEETLARGVDMIITMGTARLFYVELYARLVSRLCVRLPSLFTGRVSHLTEAFMALCDSIRTCNPNEDYDLFCKINEENERRRALGAFLMELVTAGAYEVDDVVEVLVDVQSRIAGSISTEGETYKSEELTEVLYEMLKHRGASFDDDCDCWDEITSRVGAVCAMKVRDCPGLSNKALFKCMDIRDMLS
jgi:hypothetical protein